MGLWPSFYVDDMNGPLELTAFLWKRSRGESQLENPYLPPPSIGNIGSDRQQKRKVSNWAILAGCVLGSFVAMWMGMFACWIRGGWLSLQIQRPPSSWELPLYFWFTTGCVLVSAVVVGSFVFPIAKYATRRRPALRLVALAFSICTFVTVAYETLKFQEMVELPTHTLIVLIAAYATFIAMSVLSRTISSASTG